MQNTRLQVQTDNKWHDASPLAQHHEQQERLLTDSAQPSRSYEPCALTNMSSISHSPCVPTHMSTSHDRWRGHIDHARGNLVKQLSTIADERFLLHPLLACELHASGPQPWSAVLTAWAQFVYGHRRK
ncbi:hypothetical protein PISMIDRAFT_672204 [Pisolithus microcarpus 441]|uniref:Uncharacterized protein n=1 Tax=Pisolithus microcarpus 441 TaxID=765257 RepID=A0A0D0A587_9AGAM|nr:hypothetical protein PISMIDRAFT_672204 [Pisolithus microcarpus 441]